MPLYKRQFPLWYEPTWKGPEAETQMQVEQDKWNGRVEKEKGEYLFLLNEIN